MHRTTSVSVCNGESLLLRVGDGCPRQVFTERGFVTRVLMASFDLSKLSELDEQITKVLNDMAVSVGVG